MRQDSEGAADRGLCVPLLPLLLLLVCVVCLPGLHLWLPPSLSLLPPLAFSLPAAALSLLLSPLFAFAIDEIVPQHAENSLQLDTLAVTPVEGGETGRQC